MSHPRAWVAAALSTAVAATTIFATVPAAPAAGPSVVGAQTSGDTLFPDQGNGGYDVKNYDLAIAWAMPNAITATATITATTTQQLLEQFSLDLEGLTVSAVTVDGTAAGFTRVQTAPKFKLVVTPATPVSGTFTTVVTYSGTPTAHTDPDDSMEGWTPTTGNEGAVALNEPVGSMTWFPNNNTPTDKATFTTRLTVPSSPVPGLSKMGISNGRLTATTPGAGTTTYTWTQTKQQATYLALVGIGTYTAATADVALTNGTVPEWSYSDSTIAQTSSFAASRAKLSPILKGIEKYYGPYPGTATGLVVDVSALGYALETQDRPYFETTIGQSTLIHELAHQWFGDQVSPSDWSDIWLNEGPATYIATQITQEVYAGANTETTYYNSWNTTAANDTFWSTPVAGFDDGADLFNEDKYQRGAMALAALRSALGDATFFTFMRTFQERFAGSDASTADFIALAKEVSGYDAPLTAFFQDWIYDTDKPASWPAGFELSLTSSPATGSTVDSGTPVSYTLSAMNSGKVPTGASPNGSVVEVDVTDLVAQGTLGGLPANVTRSGDTLLWALPSTAVGATATTTITATLDRATGGAIAVKARGRTLGADCDTVRCLSTITVRGGELMSSVPTIAGIVRVDESVTAVAGAWTAGTTFAYQWLRDGTPIAGATGATYAVVPADNGTALTVAVTGTKTGFTSVTRTSAPVTVAPGVLSPTPTPTVSADPTVDAPATGTVGTWDAGATLTYRWLVDGAAVDGATTTTFTPRPADAGKALTFEVTGTRAGYTTVTQTSAAQTVREAVLTPTAEPTISGTPRVGETLTAVPGTWDAQAVLTYQWLLDGSPISGATSSTYTPESSQVDRQLRVAVTGTRTGYTTATRTSAPVTVTAVDAPVSPTPTVTGTPQVGQTLTGVPGEWSDGATLTYAWLVDGVPVSDQLTYLLQPGTLDKTVVFQVTGTRTSPASTTIRASDPVTVLAGVLDPTPTPTVDGTPRVGADVIGVVGTWDPDATLTYQWLVDGTPVTDATARTYTPQAGDVGKALTFAVTGAREGYTSVTRASDAVAVVAGVLSPTPTPTISGLARTDQTLTAAPGTWDSGATLAYQWLLDGTPVAGATTTTYRAKAGDVGKALTVTVTGTRAGYTTVARTSEPVTVNLTVQAKRPRPTVTGQPVVGRTLRARPGAHDAGVALRYQWFVGGKGIPGANRTTFKVRPRDVGKRLAVAVAATKAGYVTVLKYSVPTKAVRRR